MDQINSVQAQRVWQRVRGGSELGETRTLPRLLAMEAEILHICRYLQKNTPLRDSRLLTRLREESQRLQHILAGLALVSDGDVTLAAPPSVRGSAEGLLRSCYQTRLRSVALLEELSGEGLCRSHLKRRMEEHAMTILELLGQLPRK